jgi:mRNA interferase RelE/StbE
MAKYRLEIKRSAVKEIKKLQGEDLKRILSPIKNLQENPRPAGTIKLSSQDVYRIRVGEYRILYEIFDKLVLVTIVKVGHRKEIYR